MSRFLRSALGDIFTTPSGFEYSWHEGKAAHFCTTPDCESGEVDPHTDVCWARARERAPEWYAALAPAAVP